MAGACSSTRIRAKYQVITTASSGILPPPLEYAMLSEAQKRVLVEVARRAIDAEVRRDLPEAVRVPLELPEASGVFVTIKRRGELRGCLGTLQCRGGLADEGARCAAEEASADPRLP